MLYELEIILLFLEFDKLYAVHNLCFRFIRELQYDGWKLQAKYVKVGYTILSH